MDIYQRYALHAKKKTYRATSNEEALLFSFLDSLYTEGVLTWPSTDTQVRKRILSDLLAYLQVKKCDLRKLLNLMEARNIVCKKYMSLDSTDKVKWLDKISIDIKKNTKQFDIVHAETAIYQTLCVDSKKKSSVQVVLN